MADMFAPPQPPGEHITVDDLRHKALAVRDTATSEARKLLEDNTVRIVIVSAVACAVVLSIAYWAGTRAARRR
ncbi:MAG TPA: hypothetical protein VF902_08190 [Coriobacteriia bacterium]